jgi:hypothetical protein
MAIAGNQSKRRKPLRKQIRKFVRAPFVVKQFAWRLTAGWLWICALGAILGFWGHLSKWENALLLDLNGALANFGFTPSNLKVFTLCVKLLWLFAICGFSLLQVVGFLLYVPFLPCVLLVRLLLRKRLPPYRKTREESLKASRMSGLIPKRTWGFPLLCLLLLWLVLYGQTSARSPLLLALVLTALLFCSQVGKALTFAVPDYKSTWDRLEYMAASARKFVAKTSENLKNGQILEKWTLQLTIWGSLFILRRFRAASRWLRGSASRRRIALVVLLRFMLNLAALGGISILFWALAIRFVLAPAHVPILEALLASASRAIPGIPDSSTLRVPAALETLDSLTAWLVFVLYAGPVASLFPKFQEQAIARSVADYARLRRERKAMYRFVEPLLLLQKLAREDPALAKLAQAVVQLRTYTEVEIREAFLSHPDTAQEYARQLASSPALVDFMRQLRIPIPNSEELTQELPVPPTDETTHAKVRSESSRDSTHKEEST